MQLTNLLSSGLKYVKKVTSFCQVLKKMKEKENWFFFLPHGVYSSEALRRPLRLEYGSAGVIRHSVASRFVLAANVSECNLCTTPQ